MNGLLIGRFQPFHFGHLAAVDFALSRADLLWLGIGSSNRYGGRDNPFSTNERREMILESLGPARLGRTKIFSVPDVDDHHGWVRSIDAMVPDYGVVFTTDELTAHIYSRRGTRVDRIPLINRDTLSGTTVRALILAGRKWEHLVPAGTAGVLRRIDARGRLAFPELNRLKGKLTLPDAVIEKAAYIYRKALEKGLVRGRPISLMMASALYAACRDTATPRNLKDVEEAANIKRKDIARCYRLLVKELDLRMPAADPLLYVARIASRIDITEKTKGLAVASLMEAQKRGISAGKDPMGFAAAALYLACVKNGEGRTPRDVAEAANVTEVTIRNRYKRLRESLDV